MAAVCLGLACTSGYVASARDRIEALKRESDLAQSRRTICRHAEQAVLSPVTLVKKETRILDGFEFPSGDDHPSPGRRTLRPPMTMPTAMAARIIPIRRVMITRIRADSSLPIAEAK